MILEIIDDKGFLPEGGSALMENVARLALKFEGVKSACACLTVVDGAEIKELNARTRGVDSETDVLSFPEIKWPYPRTAGSEEKLLARAYLPEYGAPFLGDIVLNVSRAREQATEYGHSLAREMGYLTAHAMLHLMGYDHMTDGDKAVMRRAEETIMSAAALTRE